MNNFNDMGLPSFLLNKLSEMNITAPTPIQASTIPLALEGKDILGSAQTGTGKTLAFVLPIITRLIDSKQNAALILTPTRELAQQILAVAEKLLGRNSRMNLALLIGGEPMPKQYKQLKSNPRIIIGTPGRVIDHLKRGTFNATNVNSLVLDETDRMFDMGFGPQIEEIFSYLPTERHTLMYSATIPNYIEKLARNYLNNPERISIGAVTSPGTNIKQEVLYMADNEKYQVLTEQLTNRDGAVIVFVRTKDAADVISDRLNNDEFAAAAIHGNLRQAKREKVVRSFRKGLIRVLVATDIAARGLDIPSIQHVVIYDLPECPEDYIHRIGRTARAGAEGNALCLVTPRDKKKWLIIKSYMLGKENTSEPANFFASRPQRDRNSRTRNGVGGDRNRSNRDRNSSAGGRDRNSTDSRTSRDYSSRDRNNSGPNSGRDYRDRSNAGTPNSGRDYRDRSNVGTRDQNTGNREYNSERPTRDYGNKEFGNSRNHSNDRDRSGRDYGRKKFGDRSKTSRPTRSTTSPRRTFAS